MKAIVKVKGRKPTPWDNGVLVSLPGDCSSLNNLSRELGQIKGMVNSDINKAGMALKDVTVSIELLIKADS